MYQSKNNGEKDPKQTNARIKKIAATLRNMNNSDIPADVMGSYTGTAEDGGAPTQDADDL